jgi:S1-C subfamily serine protease
MRKNPFRLSLPSLILFVFLAATLSAHGAPSTSSESLSVAKDLGNAFVEVAKKMQPSVVSIQSEQTVTVAPWEGFGEDFFKGTPFEDFFKGRGALLKREDKQDKDRGSLSIRKVTFSPTTTWWPEQTKSLCDFRMATN